jgi:hypothetical protein
MAGRTRIPRRISARTAAIAATVTVALVAAGVLLAFGRTQPRDESVDTSGIAPDSSSGAIALISGGVQSAQGTGSVLVPNSPGRQAEGVSARPGRRTVKPPSGGSAPAIVPGTPAGPADDPVEGARVWRLSNPHVRAKGVTAHTPQGSLIQGRVIDAEATSTDGMEAAFTITLTQFSPSSQAPAGTRQGRYYLQGSWRILPSQVPATVRNPRGALRGSLRAESGKELLAGTQEMKAVVELIGSYALGGRAARRGEYTGTAAFDGKLVTPIVPVPASQ